MVLYRLPPAASYTTMNVENGGGAVQATVMDITGKTLWVSGRTTTSQIRIQVGSLAQGTYMVLVKNNTHGVVVKLLVQR